VRITGHNRLAISVLSSVAAVMSLAALPAAASAAAGQAPVPVGVRAAAGTAAGATPALPANERRVCAVSARPGQMECQAVYRRAGRGRNAPAFVSAALPVAGYGPASLRSAYGLSRAARTRGGAATIAVVDAYRDPAAAADLASYRSHYRLGACGTASGCLRIINQNGRSAPLPRPDENWSVEESLDLDMVSAICPRCHILLVEASSTSVQNMGTAEHAAVAAGARFVSNSWSGTLPAGQPGPNHYFNHPGDAIVFASGDDGYGTDYPTDLQYVTAVGGTTLTHRRSGSRSWTETVWSGTGSGCAAGMAKPSWQRKTVDIGSGGCPNRTDNDVAAVADPATGVAVYDTYKTGGTWGVFGGTSVATPIVAAVYALAGDPARRSYPASYLYQHPARFHDVTAGSNGTCPAVSSYLCHGRAGYSGPAGVGTPNGTYGFSRLGTDPVTLVNPGAKTAKRSRSFTITITGLDTRAAASYLRYTATGLPGGLSVRSVRGSTNGQVTGTPSASIAAETIFHVAVTGHDHKTHKTGTTRFTITVS
jgi:Subtilase family